jgi:hypothetical protein
MFFSLREKKGRSTTLNSKPVENIAMVAQGLKQ